MTLYLDHCTDSGHRLRLSLLCLLALLCSHRRGERLSDDMATRMVTVHVGVDGQSDAGAVEEYEVLVFEECGEIVDKWVASCRGACSFSISEADL